MKPTLFCPTCLCRVKDKNHCGVKTIPSTDPAFMALSQKKKASMYGDRIDHIRKDVYAPVHEKKADKPFEAQAWLDKLAHYSYSFGSYVNPYFKPADFSHVKYAGLSYKYSAKAGKKKGGGYYYTVDSTPIPHEGEIVSLWHGTGTHTVYNILKDGFKPSTDGLLGPGVYFGKTVKARNYVKGDLETVMDGVVQRWGAIFKVDVVLGRVSTMNGSEKNILSSYDTRHAVPGMLEMAWGSYLRNEEWCVLDPTRIAIKEVHIFRVD